MKILSILNESVTDSLNNVFEIPVLAHRDPLDPNNDPTGAGYQILQSKTAIGSGGLFGVGLGQGTQTHLRFLPVRNSDFIISVIGEEFGLIGITMIIISFGFMIYWMINYSHIIVSQTSSLTYDFLKMNRKFWAIDFDYKDNLLSSNIIKKSSFISRKKLNDKKINFKI